MIKTSEISFKKPMLKKPAPKYTAKISYFHNRQASDQENLKWVSIL